MTTTIETRPTAPARRMTAAAIRKAVLLPKTTGEVNKAYCQLTGIIDPPKTSDAERLLLEHFAEHADLITGASTSFSAFDDSPLCGEQQWLLVPVTARQLEILAMFESGHEDLEDGHDAEPEECDDDEIREPSLSAVEHLNQARWSDGGGDGWDGEEDRADLEYSLGWNHGAPDWHPHLDKTPHQWTYDMERVHDGHE